MPGLFPVQREEGAGRAGVRGSGLRGLERRVLGLPESHPRALEVRPRVGACPTSQLFRYKGYFSLTFVWWRKGLGPHGTYQNS